MAVTPNLALPLIAAAQAQKHVTHNEAIQALDALVQCAVLDRDLTAPPGAPVDGSRYIVAAGATGVWAGKAGEVAAWQDGGWTFYPPTPGFLAFVEDEAQLRVFDGGAWQPVASGGTTFQNLALVGIGTSADAANPFSAKLDAALWTAKPVGEGGTGDLRYTMNKESTPRTLSLLFQSAYSGRAEFGLVGDDDLHLKMSSDGASWTEALRVGGGGRIGIGVAPGSERLTVAGNIAPAADNSYSLGTPSLRVSTVYAASGVVTTSDIRRKTAVEPLAPDVATALLEAARPIVFRWNAEDRERHYGWSAQDWAAALRQEDGKAGLLAGDADLSEEPLGLRVDQIVALLHASLLQARDDLADVSRRLAALEAATAGPR